MYPCSNGRKSTDLEPENWGGRIAQNVETEVERLGSQWREIEACCGGPILTLTPSRDKMEHRVIILEVGDGTAEEKKEKAEK